MSSQPNPLLDRLKTWPLVLIPHHFLSSLVRHATRWQAGWWKNLLIRRFVSHFNVDLSEAEETSAENYACFNAFFTRALKPGTRPLPEDPNAISSPVDGYVSEAGIITSETLIQAKGRQYSLAILLGGKPGLTKRFRNGHFATLYLSPRDYHRIHMPCNGRLRETLYIPGRLFSVAPHTTRALPNLFTRNERLVSLYETDHGPMTLIMVGAIFVSCMETTTAGVIKARGGHLLHMRYDESCHRGAEMGRFNMGSTVILLFGENRIIWHKGLVAGRQVRVGETIGTVDT
jgi:phosphatidylserine decarboxylase